MLSPEVRPRRKLAGRHGGQEGVYRELSEKIDIVDLPGIYSLSPYTPEEVVSRNYIMEENPRLGDQHCRRHEPRAELLPHDPASRIRHSHRDGTHRQGDGRLDARRALHPGYGGRRARRRKGGRSPQPGARRGFFPRSRALVHDLQPSLRPGDRPTRSCAARSGSGSRSAYGWRRRGSVRSSYTTSAGSWGCDIGKDGFVFSQ